MFKRLFKFLITPSTICDRYRVWKKKKDKYTGVVCPWNTAFGIMAYFQLVDDPDYFKKTNLYIDSSSDKEWFKNRIKDAIKVISLLISEDKGMYDCVYPLRAYGYFDTGILPENLESFFKELIDQRILDKTYPSHLDLKALVKKYGVEHYIFYPFIKLLGLEGKAKDDYLAKYTDELLERISPKRRYFALNSWY